jgi:branched-chain amino acid transport system permease protein
VITAAVAVIIGGLTTAWGAILGSLLLGLTHNVVAWTLSAEWQNAATFVFFVAILLVRKEGILAPQLRLEER